MGHANDDYREVAFHNGWADLLHDHAEERGYLFRVLGPNRFQFLTPRVHTEPETDMDRATVAFFGIVEQLRQLNPTIRDMTLSLLRNSLIEDEQAVR